MTVLKMEFSLMEFFLKLVDVSSIFKKENNRPVGILPHMSKVFERILYKQIDTFMTTKCSPYLCCFRKKP